MREMLYNELAYRETMVSCLRRVLREDAQDVDADEIETWAAKAEETTKGLDLLVGAIYEYLTMPKEEHAQGRTCPRTSPSPSSKSGGASGAKPAVEQACRRRATLLTSC
jgi:hypothetical protein